MNRWSCRFVKLKRTTKSVDTQATHPFASVMVYELPFGFVWTQKKTTKHVAVNKKVRTFAALEPAKPLNDAQMCGSFYLFAYG